MSLTRSAVRIATVQALVGATMVPEKSIFDSSLAPINEMVGGAQVPFIVVYTDDGTFAPQGRELLTLNGSFSLVIEYAYTSVMQIEGEDVWGATLTDQGLELSLDQIERQIKIALSDTRQAGDDGFNPWRGMWARLVVAVNSIRTERGGGAKESPRFAARQLTIDVRPVAEPPYGPAPVGVWADFFALMRESGKGLPELASRMETTVIGNRTEYQVEQSQIAATAAEAAALLITPASTAPVMIAPDSVDFGAALPMGAP